MTESAIFQGGLTLKSLLENPNQHSSIENFFHDVKKEKDDRSDCMSPSMDMAAAILGPSVWNNDNKSRSYELEEIKLEYMDLNEFLVENALPPNNGNQPHGLPGRQGPSSNGAAACMNSPTGPVMVKSSSVASYNRDSCSSGFGSPGGSSLSSPAGFGSSTGSSHGSSPASNHCLSPESPHGLTPESPMSPHRRNDPRHRDNGYGFPDPMSPHPRHHHSYMSDLHAPHGPHGPHAPDPYGLTDLHGPAPHRTDPRHIDYGGIPDLPPKHRSNDYSGLPDLPDTSLSDHEDFISVKRRLSSDEMKPQPFIKKARKVFVAEASKDQHYWARRRKNNLAAKRSRDARRLKEHQIAIRASFLEEENDILRKKMMEVQHRVDLLEHKLSSYEAGQS